MSVHNGAAATENGVVVTQGDGVTQRLSNLFLGLPKTAKNTYPHKSAHTG